MKLWTRLSLAVLIDFVPPRVLFYVNRAIPNLRRSVGTRNTAGARRDAHGAGSTRRARPPISKPEFLDSGFLRSPEGILAFKKLPDSPVLPEYLECQLEGLAYFDAVFREAADRRPPYRDFMAEHHRILASGRDGKRCYAVGKPPGARSLDVAGRLRSPEDRVAILVYEKPLVRAILRALTETELYPQGQWQIQIEGIPKEARSLAIRNRKGFSILYPDVKYLPLYSSRMEAELSLIRELSSDPSPDRSLLIRSLASYFQLGIHGHAFVRINQSLLWAQVNYLLMLNRFPPVHHAYVDLAAAFLDTGPFCDYFARHVAAASARLNARSV